MEAPLLPLYVVHKQPILQFFKTKTVKNLHGTANRFSSKMELGDDAGNSH